MVHKPPPAVLVVLVSIPISEKSEVVEQLECRMTFNAVVRNQHSRHSQCPTIGEGDRRLPLVVLV